MATNPTAMIATTTSYFETKAICRIDLVTGVTKHPFDPAYNYAGVGRVYNALATNGERLYGFAYAGVYWIHPSEDGSPGIQQTLVGTFAPECRGAAFTPAGWMGFSSPQIFTIDLTGNLRRWSVGSLDGTGWTLLGSRMVATTPMGGLAFHDGKLLMSGRSGSGTGIRCDLWSMEFNPVAEVLYATSAIPYPLGMASVDGRIYYVSSAVGDQQRGALYTMSQVETPRMIALVPESLGSALTMAPMPVEVESESSPSTLSRSSSSSSRGVSGRASSQSTPSSESSAPSAHVSFSWSKGIAVWFDRPEGVVVKSVSFGLAVDDHDYAYFVDETGEATRHTFDPHEIKKMVRQNSVLNVMVGIEDQNGVLTYARATRRLSDEAGAPFVEHFRGSQRTDGSGLVDFRYDYFDEEEVAVASAKVEISSDGGLTYAAATASAVGDVGDGVDVRTGVDRHFVWDPAADLPASDVPVVVFARLTLTNEDGVAAGEAVSGSVVVDVTRGRTPVVTAAPPSVRVPTTGGGVKSRGIRFEGEDAFESSSSSSSKTTSSLSSTVSNLSSASSSSSVVETWSTYSWSTLSSASSPSTPPDLTPVMTAWDAPAPYTVTESSYSYDKRGWLAFSGPPNGDSGSSWWVHLASSPMVPGHWVELGYGGSKTYVRRYRVVAYDSQTAPRTWQIKGSLDGVTYRVVDARGDQSFSAATDFTNEYDVEDPGAYRSYRLEVMESSGYPGNLVIVHRLSFY